MQQSPAMQDAKPPDLKALHESVFVTADAEVHDVPMSVIKRPLQSVLDEAKVQAFMQEIQAGTDMAPIEVAWVTTPSGDNYYFAFGGCHRWEANKRLHSPTISAKLVKMSPDTISMYLGSSSPFRQGRPQQGGNQQRASNVSSDLATAVGH